MSTNTRQRLLESRNISPEQTIDQAKALEQAQRSSELYSLNYIGAATKEQTNVSATDTVHVQRETSTSTQKCHAVSPVFQKCYFCGRKRHPRSECPAKESVCHSCGKLGHFSKVCKQKTPVNTASIIIASVKSSKKPALETVEIDNKYYVALIDTGSQKIFISGNVARSLGKKIDNSNIVPVTMASSDLETKTVGAILTDVKLQNRTYKKKFFCFKFIMLRCNTW